MSIAWGQAVLKTRTQLRRRWRTAGRTALGCRLKQEDHPSSQMFSVRGTVDAQSPAYHAATPSFASRPDARVAAVRLTPLANRNRNLSVARSSGDFQVTVTLDSLDESDPFAPPGANLPAMTRPHSFAFFTHKEAHIFC